MAWVCLKSVTRARNATDIAFSVDHAYRPHPWLTMSCAHRTSYIKYRARGVCAQQNSSFAVAMLGYAIVHVCASHLLLIWQLLCNTSEHKMGIASSNAKGGEVGQKKKEGPKQGRSTDL